MQLTPASQQTLERINTKVLEITSRDGDDFEIIDILDEESDSLQPLMEEMLASPEGIKNGLLSEYEGFVRAMLVIGSLSCDLDELILDDEQMDLVIAIDARVKEIVREDEEVAELLFIIIDEFSKSADLLESIFDEMDEMSDEERIALFAAYNGFALFASIYYGSFSSEDDVEKAS